MKIHGSYQQKEIVYGVNCYILAGYYQTSGACSINDLSWSMAD